MYAMIDVFNIAKYFKSELSIRHLIIVRSSYIIHVYKIYCVSKDTICNKSLQIIHNFLIH